MSLAQKFFARPYFHTFALLVVASLLWAVWYFGFAQRDQLEYRLVPVQKGAITATVAASGTLNAVTTVTVGTQVSGQIKELYVDFNSEVKQGQLIAQIDPQNFEYQVSQSQANLEAARSTVKTQEANIVLQQAQVAQVDVNLANAKRDYERKQMLLEKNFISPADRDTAQATYNAAQAQLRAAQAQLDVVRAQANNARALVLQSEAQLSQARVSLDKTKIMAPVNGVVIKRSVELGQTVAASLQSPELFIIAKDLRDMQVETAIDESDVGKIRVGQDATFTVDAFSGRSFSGTVKQIRKSAANVSNVVTYTVIISANNPSLLLLPGMTANVRIVTDTRDNVLKLSNAALRYKPAKADADSADANKAAAAGGVNSGGANAGASSGGNAGSKLRERLITELHPDEAQKQQLDTIFEELRGKMMALRDASAEDRPKLAERNRAEMRSRIEAILKPEQKARYAELVAELDGRAASGRATNGKVYVLDKDNQPKVVAVRLGLSDGTMTEVLSSEANLLAEQTPVITGVLDKGSKAGASAGSGSKPASAGPRMPF
ncbi:efflux RND transporter periplasmic adaptor subunit [Ampullimonas aquatilis]|uniref:efflux RND transporter periplasmic adaptor subunit n=1 Tax=Ampullimonas aquatilis TaxID=1341549 RepID=UPI003C74CDB7